MFPLTQGETARLLSLVACRHKVRPHASYFGGAGEDVGAPLAAPFLRRRTESEEEERGRGRGRGRGKRRPYTEEVAK